MPVYPFEKLATNQLSHTNRIGEKAASLLLLTKPLSPEISEISGSYVIRHIVLHLDNTTSEPPIVHYNQATNNLFVLVQDYRNF